jgi:hypothetical protein
MDIVYKGSVDFGRRGVMSLNESNKIHQRKLRQRERENKFAQKFAGNVGMSSREFR